MESLENGPGIGDVLNFLDQLYNIQDENTTDLEYIRQLIVSCNYSCEEPLTLDYFTSYRLYNKISTYSLPAIFIFGIVTSLLLFVVLWKTDTFKKSTSVFMKALTVSDLLVLLLGLLVDYIGHLSGLNILGQSDFLCKAANAFLHFGTHFSSWLIVVITCERLLVVRFPLKAREMCTIKQARWAVGGTGIPLFIANLHFFWTVGIQPEITGIKSVCTAQEEDIHFIYQVWPWFDAFIYSALPLLLIICLNSVIIRRITCQRKVELHGALKGKFRRRQWKVTISLLLVSSIFVFTTVPVCCISILGRVFNNPRSIENALTFLLLHKIAKILMYAGHTVNFCFYFGTAKSIKRELFKLAKPSMFRKPSTSRFTANIEMETLQRKSTDSEIYSVLTSTWL